MKRNTVITYTKVDLEKLQSLPASYQDALARVVNLLTDPELIDLSLSINPETKIITVGTSSPADLIELS